MKTGKAVTLKTDIYTLGLIFGLMRYQTLDFKTKLGKDLKDNDGIADLINKMILVEPASRINIELVAHNLTTSNHISPNSSMNKSTRTLTTMYNSKNTLGHDPENSNRSYTPTNNTLSKFK
jgi:hypothetical protein